MQSKCQFGQSSIAYLGHILSVKGLKIDPEKFATIVSWPFPSTLKEVRGFLGLTGYYRCFVKRYAHLASPLTDLLKKNLFVWSAVATLAFTHLNDALSLMPVLSLSNFSKDFVVENEASGNRIGAVLCQDNHLIAFFSQKLSFSIQTASTYNSKIFAITQAIQKWRQYLLSHRFLILSKPWNNNVGLAN